MATTKPKRTRLRWTHGALFSTELLEQLDALARLHPSRSAAVRAALEHEEPLARWRSPLPAAAPAAGEHVTVYLDDAGEQRLRRLCLAYRLPVACVLRAAVGALYEEDPGLDEEPPASERPDEDRYGEPWLEPAGGAHADP